MKVDFRKFIRENVIFRNEYETMFLFKINGKMTIISNHPYIEMGLKRDKWIWPLTVNTGYLPSSFYENHKFNKIVLDCMPVDELKAFLVSFIKQAKENKAKDIKWYNPNLIKLMKD